MPKKADKISAFVPTCPHMSLLVMNQRTTTLLVFDDHCIVSVISLGQMKSSSISTEYNEANGGSVLADQPMAVRPIYMRFPRSGNCLYTGLSRSKLYELTSGDNPPVKAISLKTADQQRGTRLINFQSLLDYIESFARKSQKTQGGAK